MTKATLSGVIAAVATPVEPSGAPDIARATKLARYLLDNGCDGLNVLGTTGEATSFSLDERKRVMRAYRNANLPMARLMVGTGAAALADAVALARGAAELGFAGALVLPPFYYKGVPDDGLAAYIDALVRATAQKPIPIYLYHFPQQSGLHWHVKLVRRLLDRFGARIVGLKDSSGDMAYAREHAGVPLRLDLDQAPAGARRCDRHRPDSRGSRPAGADRRQGCAARQHGGAGGVQCERVSWSVASSAGSVARIEQVKTGLSSEAAPS